MLKLKPQVIARTVAAASELVVLDFQRGDITSEESMTDRLIQAIRTALNDKEIGGYNWRARTLKNSSGRSAEERVHGADVLGVLEVDLPDYQVKKGFLWQAKIIEKDVPLSKKEWERFQEQCSRMLSRTRDSFAAIYSREAGVRFVPAEVIIEIDRDQVYGVGFRSIHGFFKDHIKCEVGDRKLNSPKIEILDRLIGAEEPLPVNYGARRALSLKVSP